jgi:hypothetical protein
MQVPPRRIVHLRIKLSLEWYDVNLRDIARDMGLTYGHVIQVLYHGRAGAKIWNAVIERLGYDPRA